MKLVLTADWHLRDDVPTSRTDRDTYFETQFSKVEYLVNYAKRLEASIIVAGDIFHKPKVSPKLINRLHDVLSIVDVPIFVLPGNHDVLNHNIEQLHECSYKTLHNMGIICDLAIKYDQDLDLISADLEFSSLNGVVKIIHTLIWPETKINKGFTVDEIFEMYPENLLVCGDNHKTFVAKRHQRTLVNPGSLLRMSADQKDHRPSFFVYDTDTRALEQIYIPIKDNVLTDVHIVEEKEKNERMEAFITKVNTSWEAEVDFVKNMDKYLETNKHSESIIQKIRNILGVK